MYVFEELANHSNKMLFNLTENKAILEKFSFPQYNEIELIIKNNEKFGNNILRNLKTSYSIVGYIINQYLFRSLFSTNYGTNDVNMIKSILEDFNIDASDISNQIYKINKYVDDVSKSDYSIAINEYITSLTNDKNKLKSEKNNLDDKIFDISNTYDQIFKEALEENLNKIKDEIKNKEDLLNKIKALSKNDNNLTKKIQIHII